MEFEFYLYGGLLALGYNLITTSRKDYRKIGWLRSLFGLIMIAALNWSGLAISIAIDIEHIKRKARKTNKQLAKSIKEIERLNNKGINKNSL